jgi:hypothetical protein
LQGALMDCDWRQIPEDLHQQLRREWDAQIKRCPAA